MTALIERFRDPDRDPNTLHFEIDPDIGYKLMKGRGHNRPAECPGVIVIELDEDGEPQDVVTVSDSTSIVEGLERALGALQDTLAVLRSTGIGEVAAS